MTVKASWRARADAYSVAVGNPDFMSGSLEELSRLDVFRQLRHSTQRLADTCTVVAGGTRFARVRVWPNNMPPRIRTPPNAMLIVSGSSSASQAQSTPKTGTRYVTMVARGAPTRWIRRK